jgi:hypothetical protein
MKKPALGGLWWLVLRLPDLKTVKHYVYLGAYFGAFAFLAHLVKQWDDAAKAVRQGDTLGLIGIFLLFCLLGGGIGWLIGRYKAYAEKRRSSSNESLIVRR